MRGDAVVAREHHEAYVVERARRHLALRRCQPGTDLAHPAECPGRRGEPGEAFAGEDGDGGGGRGDAVLVHGAASLGAVERRAPASLVP